MIKYDRSTEYNWTAMTPFPSLVQVQVAGLVEEQKREYKSNAYRLCFHVVPSSNLPLIKSQSIQRVAFSTALYIACEIACFMY